MDCCLKPDVESGIGRILGAADNLRRVNATCGDLSRCLCCPLLEPSVFPLVASRDPSEP